MGKPTSDELKKMEVSHLGAHNVSAGNPLNTPGSQKIPSYASGNGLFKGQDFVETVPSYFPYTEFCLVMKLSV